ncbi:MAG: MBL fold metallo-hydrolase [Ktedonobacteraceae bacterium]
MSDAERFFVRFWGVRGSYPTPGAHTVRHGGNTACIEVQAGEHTLIFDAGSGIIRLGEDLLSRAPDQPLDISLLITHAHSDHLIGFPFFSPLFERRTAIDIFGPTLQGRTIERILTPLMSPPYFPVDIHTLPSQRRFHTITSGQCIVWRPGADSQPCVMDNTQADEAADLRVFAKFTRSHPMDGALHYRVEYAGHSIVYATDVEWDTECDPEFLAFARGADLLIHDAQYTAEDYAASKHGFGHSTVGMATDVARAAQVGALILFHHEPNYDDAKLDALEKIAQASFAHARSAYEGMTIDMLTTGL